MSLIMNALLNDSALRADKMLHCRLARMDGEPWALWRWICLGGMGFRGNLADQLT